MTKLSRVFLTVFFASLAAAAHAANPTAVFIGDYITANWVLPPGYVNLGVNTPDSYTSNATSGYWATNFDQVVNLHPAIVHVIVGAEDAALEDDGTLPIVNSMFVQNIESIVSQAHDAGIKVILGTTIASAPGNLGINEMNGFILQYGAANGITTVNYANALTNYGGGQNWPPATPGQPYQTQPYLTTNASSIPGVSLPIPSTAGYALMTQMAQSAIASVSGATPRSGYLQDVGFGMGRTSDFPTPVFSQNTVAPGYSLQFTPMGTYSNGITYPMLNSNIAGASGTWTSNNPAVMYVNEYGMAEALSPGTAWIYYTSPQGVTFSPWVMTVNSNIP